jgi:hypothetical protein
LEFANSIRAFSDGSAAWVVWHAAPLTPVANPAMTSVTLVYT